MKPVAMAPMPGASMQVASMQGMPTQSVPMRRAPMQLAGVLLLAFAAAAAGQDHARHRAAATQAAPEQHEHHHAPTEREGHQHRHAPAKPAKQAAAEAVDHAAMGHAPPATDPRAGHATQQPKDAGHSPLQHGHAPATPVDHSAMGHEAPAAPDLPREPIPELTDADRAAAFPPLDGHPAHDDRRVRHTRFNRLETWHGDHGSGLSWEGSSWFGSDWNKLWLRSEGEREGGRTEAADLEVLYGRPVARWWDAVVGLRHDVHPGPSQTWLAVGVMGLAPQWFEFEATAYLGESGQVAASAEVEYELLLTNRLVLQPLLEVELHGEGDPERGIGSGLSTAEAGLRLRYEFTRQLAPYVGVVWERAYGGTADLRRAEGDDIDDTRVVAGIRFWF